MCNFLTNFAVVEDSAGQSRVFKVNTGIRMGMICVTQYNLCLILIIHVVLCC